MLVTQGANQHLHASSRSTSSRHAPSPHWRAAAWHALFLALTLLTFLIHGYHPLAEDGGLYLAGVQIKLHPTLFPHDTAFVTEHLRFSLFVPSLVAFIRLTHIPFAWSILLIDLFTLWLTFFAARKIMARCIAHPVAQLAGLCLLSALWTLPIAGTSLFFMDPYLTGRSLSTPLSLLAIAYALDTWPTFASLRLIPSHNRALPVPDAPIVSRTSWHRRPHPLLSCALALFAASLFHPLMAAYALAFIIALRLGRLPQRRLAEALLLLAALTLALLLKLLAPPESPALFAAEITRYYWFLSQWHWFELLGLVGPLAIFAALRMRLRHRHTPRDLNALALCRASLVLGFIAITIALLFAHQNTPTHLVARLQPLRCFLLLYAIMTLLLGATLTQRLIQSSPRNPLLRRCLLTLPALIFVITAAAMFSVQRLTFPASPHLELPSTTSQNPWTRAFLWARSNTPPDALFALDARYINTPGEDAQTFRATALRSALPDYSKDGGEAAITPSLAPLWQPSALAQAHLSSLSDIVRDQRLQSFHVTWVVLDAHAVTAHPCPYDNGTVKICKL
jgi:hypothetical protein